MPEKVTFKTADGVSIVGNYWKGSSGKAVLLLHMMPATKESWNLITGNVNKLGHSVLAIDLRGHGESRSQDGKRLDYSRFSNAEHAASIKDVQAAISFLKEKGDSSFAIIGASIGANFALAYAANDTAVRTVVLLSPGLDYRSVKTELAAQKITRPVLIVVSADDGYSTESSKVLAQKAKSAELKILSRAGHGTDMFSDKSLKPLLLDWLKKNL